MSPPMFSRAFTTNPPCCVRLRGHRVRKTNRDRKQDLRDMLGTLSFATGDGRAGRAWDTDRQICPVRDSLGVQEAPWSP